MPMPESFILLKNGQKHNKPAHSKRMISFQHVTILFVSIVTLSSSSVSSSNSLRGLNDPKTVMEKGTSNPNNPDGNCPPRNHSVTFRSQYMEDQMIYNKFYARKHKCNGIVLEIGGMDGMRFSNSWFFQYGLHWDAILVEANPTLYDQMITNRPDATNIWRAICLGEKTQFQLADMEATGGILTEMTEANRKTIGNRGIIHVPCTTVSNILRNHQIHHVDVFFLDVEGAEWVVIDTMDWESVQIDILVIEMTFADLPKNERIRKRLQELGYKTPFSMIDLCVKIQIKMGLLPSCMQSDVFVREDFLTNLEQD